MSKYIVQSNVKMLCLAALVGAAVVLPHPVFAFTFEQVWSGTILTLYGGIGFFGMAACIWFLGGWAVYVARRGQEYRLEGLYAMAQGVRVLCLVVIGAVILYLIT